MIEGPTVFILGAGAACPYGFPSAKDLRQQICFDFPGQYFQWLINYKIDKEQRVARHEHAVDFSKKFFDSHDSSIDIWLSKNREFWRIGKIAITLMLLQAEHQSGFAEKSKKPDQDWYSYIWSKMTEDFTDLNDYKRFSENQIDFIIFNYDRSVEQFFFESLRYGFFGAGNDTIIEELNKRKFIHVYGKIAPLEWQAPDNIPYRTPPGYINLADFAHNLKIVYEAEDDPQLEAARSLIQKAKRIFFLGFGYRKENLKILKIPDILGSRHKVYGTALNYTKKEVADVKSLFRVCVPVNLNIVNTDCLGLLREYL